MRKSSIDSQPEEDPLSQFVKEELPDELRTQIKELPDEFRTEIKEEPELIIEDICDDSSDTVSVHLKAGEDASQTKIQLDTLLSLNQHILDLVEKINFKVNGASVNGETLDYHGGDEVLKEESEDDVEIVEEEEFPVNIKAKTISEVVCFNRIYKSQKHREKLEDILKESLAGHESDIDDFLQTGLNLLMTREVQCFVHEMQPPLAVKRLLNIAHDVFKTPLSVIEHRLQSAFNGCRKKRRLS